MPEESSSLPETIGLLFKALRYMLVALNSIVILVALYFLFSSQNLGGEKLRMATWLRVIYSILVISSAIYGIVVALWTGKKCKRHLRMIGGYLAAIWTLGLLGIILASVYVRKPTKYDIVFIVITTVAAFLLSVSSIAFGYALKKTKLLRRLNVISSD